MGFVTVHNILQSHKNNECQNFIIYGPLGVGKSSYALQILMEIYKTKDPEILKQYFFFSPVEFLRALRRFKEQIPALVWDDAGVWLYYLDFHSPVVKSIAKMMQLIRTKTSSVIFTTPTPTLILGKLRSFPQTVTIKVVKNAGGEQWGRPLRDLRTAKAYRAWLLPDLQKLRIKKLYEDTFGVYLPTPLYNWHIQERAGYIRQIEEEIEKNLPKSMKEQKQMEAIV